MRVGGLGTGKLAEGRRRADPSYAITDLDEVRVAKGIMPDLFREGQGVSWKDGWPDGSFRADEVLAKHDESTCRRRPEALRKSGQWKGGAEK